MDQQQPSHSFDFQYLYSRPTPFLSPAASPSPSQPVNASVIEHRHHHVAPTLTTPLRPVLQRNVMNNDSQPFDPSFPQSGETQTLEGTAMIPVDSRVVRIETLLPFIRNEQGFHPPSQEALSFLRTVVPRDGILDFHYINCSDALHHIQFLRFRDFSMCQYLMTILYPPAAPEPPVVIGAVRDGEKLIPIDVPRMFQGKIFDSSLIVATLECPLTFKDPVSDGRRQLCPLMPFTVLPGDGLAMFKGYLRNIIAQLWKGDEFIRISSAKIEAQYAALDDLVYLVFAKAFLLGFGYSPKHPSLSSITTILKSALCKVREDLKKKYERAEAAAQDGTAEEKKRTLKRGYKMTRTTMRLKALKLSESTLDNAEPTK